MEMSGEVKQVRVFAGKVKVLLQTKKLGGCKK